ncbi:MAG: hypothetical protein PHG39_01710 [Acidithiobacillus ferrooxidans]|nr:hypothetical protein [Acidithiobacillus ferrooxidans]
MTLQQCEAVFIGGFEAGSVGATGISLPKPFLLTGSRLGDQMGVMPGVGEDLDEFTVNNRQVTVQKEEFLVSANGPLGRR